MERKVKGIWIPLEIWQDSTLSWNEKVLVMEVDSFTAKGEPCVFSNEYIAALLGVSVRSVPRIVSNVIDKGYVTLQKFDGRRRFLESNLTFGRRSSIRKNTESDFAQTQRQTTHESEGRLRTNADHNIYYNKYVNKSLSKDKHIEGFDFRKELETLGVSSEVAEAWLQVRKAKRAVNSRIAFDKVAREVAKSGKSADECIRTAVERSWSGFEASWLEERHRPERREKSAFEKNLEVQDALFGTNLHEQYYGHGEGSIDEQ